MKRFDLRHLGAEFGARMCELVERELKNDEVGIFLFEIGDFSGIEKSANLIAQNGWTLMNSLRFNEVDWTIIIKKARDSSIRNSQALAEESKKIDSSPMAQNDKVESDSNA